MSIVKIYTNVIVFSKQNLIKRDGYFLLNTSWGQISGKLIFALILS